MGTASSQFLQFSQQGVVVGNPLLHEANHPGLVNDVGDAPTAEELPNFVTLIGQQREVDPVLTRELLMGLQTVATDAQNLGIQLFKAREVALKSL